MKFLKVLGIFSLLIFIYELILCYKGNMPGVFIQYNNFNTSGDIHTFNFYENDEEGIYRINPSIHNWLDLKLAKDTTNNSFDFKLSDGIDKIIYDFQELNECVLKNNLKQDNQSEFENRFLNMDSTNCFDQLLLEYLKFPINKDGFKSIPFNNTNCNKPKVMLVGDSFVWGMSANPIYASFADLLLTKDYLVYNFGIPGTDPAQYKAIVEKYLPIIQPDIVIVVFFPGNDFMRFPRETKEEEPMEHATSLGFFESNPLGKYLPPEETINFYKAINSVPQTTLFNKIMSKTNTSTQLWLFLYHLRIVDHPNRRAYFYSINQSPIEKIEIVRPYLEGIRSICTENNVKLLETIIPEKKMMFNDDKEFGDKILNKDALNLLFNNKLLYPKNICLNDFEEDGVHFNNIGSKKYAYFLDSLIQYNLTPIN